MGTRGRGRCASEAIRAMPALLPAGRGPQQQRPRAGGRASNPGPTARPRPRAGGGVEGRGRGSFLRSSPPLSSRRPSPPSERVPAGEWVQPRGGGPNAVGLGWAGRPVPADPADRPPACRNEGRLRVRGREPRRGLHARSHRGAVRLPDHARRSRGRRRQGGAEGARARGRAGGREGGGRHRRQPPRRRLRGRARAYGAAP